MRGRQKRKYLNRTALKVNNLPQINNEDSDGCMEGCSKLGVGDACGE